MTCLQFNLLQGDTFYCCAVFVNSAVPLRKSNTTDLSKALVLFKTRMENMYSIMQYITLQETFFYLYSSSSSSPVARQPASGPGLFKISPPDVPVLCKSPPASHIWQQRGVPPDRVFPSQFDGY